MATQPANSELPTATKAPALPARDSFDDMHDSPREWEQYSEILPLAACREITGAFDEVDTKALKFQKWHRGITFIVAYTATAAVVAAIVGLWYLSGSGKSAAQSSAEHAAPQSAEGSASGAPSRGREVAEGVFNYVEVTTAGVTLLIVGFGTLVGFKRKWMIYRHKAELYRLLRYRFLIQPAVWRAGKDPKPWIQSRMSEIAGISGNKDLEEAVKQPSPHGPFEGTQCRLPARTIYALTQYYLAKRLSPQRDYLADRAHRNELKDRLRRYLPAFFFSSIVAVFIKFLNTKYEWNLGWLILFAALPPVFAAGIRTYLAAFEFSRNKSRFHAAHKSLAELQQSLISDSFTAVSGEMGTAASPSVRLTLREEATLADAEGARLTVRTEEQSVTPPASALSDEETDAYAVLRDLSWCEHILDTEHREWLRLMHDADWFG